MKDESVHSGSLKELLNLLIVENNIDFMIKQIHEILNKIRIFSF